MVTILRYDTYFSLAIELINKFIPIRELLNVIKIAFTIIKSHIFKLTARHWYLFVCFILFISLTASLILSFFQKYNNNSILRHIKLRHNWVLYETPEYPKYCTYCSGIIKKRFLLMGSYEGWQCLICKRISHLHCIMQSDFDSCKIECSLNRNLKNSPDIQLQNYNFSSDKISTSFGKLKSKQNVHLHLLIKGNLHSGAICSICKTVCFSPFGLYGQRCAWCNRTYHDECAQNNNIVEQPCDLGALKYIILPPNSFSVEVVDQEKNTDLIIDKKISSFDDRYKKKTVMNDTNHLSLQRDYMNYNGRVKQINQSTLSNRRRISQYIQIFHKNNKNKRLKLFDDYTNSKSGKPLLVFVNTRSGGHLGQGIIRDLYIYLNPIQIVDIQNSKGPDEALLLFKCLAEMKKLIILVCGGDGTVRWVIDRCRDIYGVSLDKLPPIAVLPLGTGNDLSRILGWDVSFNGDILCFLKKLCVSNIKQMDIWTCTAWNTNEYDTGNGSSNKLFSSTFINYLDIGIAARIALKFHTLRETYPQHFNSRLGNQLVYGEVGLRDFFNKSIKLDGLKLFCDGNEVDISDQIDRSQTIKSDDFINSISINLKNEVSYVQVYFRFLLAYLNTIKRYIIWILVPINDFLGTSKYIGINNDNSFDTDVSNINFNSRENKLEGLIICNIPSFSGGVNLWKISNKVREKTHADYEYKIRTAAHTNKKIVRTIFERSMSFTVNNFKNSGYISCSNSEQSELNEIDNPKITIKSDRRKSTSILKSWFSKAFKQNSPFNSQIDELSQTSNQEYEKNFEMQKIDDGLIEVVGIKSLFHLTQLQVGLTEAIKLCQGSNIIVEIPRQVPFQVDGEPKIINKCKLIIESSGKIPVLCSEKVENALSLPVKNALEQAVERNIINVKQKRWITERIAQERTLIS
ncbi:Diacylglycerol kinase [Cryptosporidium felis]|nr:Diacylglycerol kinase [Cryptosporidium felis]